MVGGKGTHGTRRFIRRLKMSRALGISYTRGIRRTRGRERRKGTWWDRKNNCIAIEGLDFAQDTQEGGADEFEFILDSDEEGGANGPSLNGDDDEFVPETEPQDIVALNKGRPRLGTMLHEWRRIISEEAQQCARQIATKEQTKLTTCSEEKDSTKEELHQNVSFSDLETDDEASWLEDGVDLRGHSQVEEDSWVQNGKDSNGCSHVEGDDFKDKVNELIIDFFPAYKDVLRSAKR